MEYHKRCSRRGVEILLSLRHPNIIEVEETKDGYKTKQMKDILSLYCEFRPDYETQRRWIVQIQSALDYIHAKGIIHCDLRLSNVLIDDEMNAFLGDFGSFQYEGVRCIPESTPGYSPYFGKELLVIRDFDTHCFGKLVWAIFNYTDPPYQPDSNDILRNFWPVPKEYQDLINRMCTSNSYIS